MELDRVVAIVNGELVLDSDVDEELRFERLTQVGLRPAMSVEAERSQAISQLINLRLILQQIHAQPEFDISDEDVTEEIGQVRRAIPGCVAAHCETQAGWSALLASKGFTEAEFRERWLARMQVLAFTEQRFRGEIKITPEQIAKYYNDTLTPQEKAMHNPVPPLEAVSTGIEAILVEQQITALLDDWRRSLRAQGSVVVMHPGEQAP